jgi:hypothetical protein
LNLMMNIQDVEGAPDLPRSLSAICGRALGEWDIPILISFFLGRWRCKGKEGERACLSLPPATIGALPVPHPQVDTAIAEETRNSVQAEEIKANEKASKAQAIADDAQKDLDEALPALDAALASLRNLNKNDVTEVGIWASPGTHSHLSLWCPLGSWWYPQTLLLHIPWGLCAKR